MRSFPKEIVFENFHDHCILEIKGKHVEVYGSIFFKILFFCKETKNYVLE